MCFGGSRILTLSLALGWKDYKYDSPGRPGVKASARRTGQSSSSLKGILLMYVFRKCWKTAIALVWVLPPRLVPALEQNSARPPMEKPSLLVLNRE